MSRMENKRESSACPCLSMKISSLIVPIKSLCMTCSNQIQFEAGNSMLIGRALAVVILLRFRTSVCQEGIFLVDIWRRACLVRWSLRMKRLSQTGQTNFFSPVCVRRWRESSSERANFLSQPSQLQLNGFSPAGMDKNMIRGILHAFWLLYKQKGCLSNPANLTTPYLCEF